MTAPPTTGRSWLEANQRRLMAALAEVRAALQHAPLPEPDALDPEAPQSALDRLAAVFGLSRFEKQLLVLAAAPELDSSFAQLCATAQGDPLRGYPTLSLALAVLPEAHWSALSPGAPLRRWRMIEIGAGNALTASPIRIDERVLHYLTGVFAPEPRLAGIIAPIEWKGALAPSHAKLAEQIVQAWSGENSPVVQLRGDGAAIKRAIATTAAARANLRLSVASIQAIPTAPHETEALIRLWEREAALDGRALLIEADDYDFSDGPRTAAVTRLIDRSEGVVLVAVREPRRFGTRLAVGLEVPALTAAEQHGVWLSALGDVGVELNGQIELVSSQFNLTADAIHRAAADARGRTEPGDQADLPVRLGRALWDVCRELARPRLEDLAQRIDSAPAWDDLVLPEGQRQVLREIGAHVRQRAVVYERWGFAKRGARGLGISALFAGTSGTGKTMAAEVLAHDLGLDLYRIDLSAVVSKYIGETEKNLRRIFDAAEEGGAVLLFDEADALFGKRSEVKDSHDRYANIEVSYLLQRMETYRGLAVLTTNMRSALDTAFLRRLRFVVQFPFPDHLHRAEIWRRIFPSSTPLDGFDPERLARLNVAGGNIRNIALNAAFLAADAGEPVRMTHLLRATRSEYAKLEKPLTETEIGGWDERATSAPEIRVR